MLDQGRQLGQYLGTPQRPRVLRNSKGNDRPRGPAEPAAFTKIGTVRVEKTTTSSKSTLYIPQKGESVYCIRLSMIEYVYITLIT